MPFILKWRDVTKPGTVTDVLLSQVDVMTTVASLLELELPRDSAEDSHNFLPWLAGEAADPPRGALVHNTKAGHYATHQGSWLLVDQQTGYTPRQAPPAWNEKHRQPPDDDQPVELHNLKQDIGQRRNQAATHPDKVAELQALPKKLREQGHSTPRLD